MNPTEMNSPAATPASTNSSENAMPMGRPGTGLPSSGDVDFCAPPKPDNKVILIAACVVGAGLLMCGLGLMFSGGGKDSAPVRAAAVPAENYFTQQQKMAREAMDMAREAQALQRERMEMMRKEMEMGGEGMGSASEETAWPHGGN